MFFSEISGSLYAWDLADKGIERILDNLQEMTDCPSSRELTFRPKGEEIMNILISVGILITLLTGHISNQQFYSILQNHQKIRTWTHISSGLSSDVQSKLKALETAHAAGILTDQEYNTKKAELEAQLLPAVPPMDEATKQKLQAIETAHQAGILNDEEYERKKAELLGQKPGMSFALYQDPQGRFQFRHPIDWNIQVLKGEQEGIALTRGKAALNIMPLPDGVVSSQQVVDSIVGQIAGQWQNYKEIQRGQQEIAGKPAPMVDFTGVNPEGLKAHGQVVAHISDTKGYVFILIAPENEPENRFEAIQPVWRDLLGSFAPVMKKGKSYRHPTGFSFLYPDDWTANDQDGFIQLAPPDASSTAEGPTELYFLTVLENISADGVQSPDDPMMLQYLDQQIQSLSPALQRTGTISHAEMREGNGIILDWGATGTGGEVRARAFVGIIRNNGAILIGMGLKERIEARDKVLHQMFATFGLGDPQPDFATSLSQPQLDSGATASATISAGEVGDPNWGFKFRPPEGWKYQKNAEAVILGHDTIAGAIFVLPHMEESLQAVQTEMQNGLTDEGVQLFPAGTIQPLGNNALAGEYTGTFNGEQVKARGIGTFSPYGGGAYIVAVTTPQMYGTKLSGAAEAIARAMQYFKVEASDLMRIFVGTWANATTNTLTNMTFSADGSYDDTYEASYSGDLTDGTFKTGDWGVARQDQGKGRWTVRGNERQGKIIIKLHDGTENILEYRVHVEKGETYWREYWFNGAHYRKIR